MVCRSCGATIAEKAIICYRCGAATVDPATLVPPRPPVVRRSVWPVVAAIVIIIGLAVWLVPKTPADSTARWAAWAGVVVATVAAVLILRPRPRERPRRLL